jgi:hypothetical protein
MCCVVAADFSVSPAIKFRCLGDLRGEKINIPEEKPARDVCFFVLCGGFLLTIFSLVSSSVFHN